VAEDALLDIALAAVRVGQRAVVGARDRVDGEVAAHQVFFQRDIRRGVEHKAFVAGRGLAFGAGQRIFFLRFRMQEYGKSLPTGRKPWRSCHPAWRRPPRDRDP
jgi:hypothetical protein